MSVARLLRDWISNPRDRVPTKRRIQAHSGSAFTSGWGQRTILYRDWTITRNQYNFFEANHLEDDGRPLKIDSDLVALLDHLDEIKEEATV